MAECFVCESTQVRDNCETCGEPVCIDHRENLCTECGRTYDFKDDCRGNIQMVCGICQELFNLTYEDLNNCHDWDEDHDPHNLYI